MHWSEPLEKVSRAVLWLALASIFVMVPIGVMKQQSAEAALKTEVQKTKDQLADALKPSGPRRFTVKEMGVYLNALDVSEAEGRVWFTNVSAVAGVICLHGVATNPTTKQTSESLPSCEAIPAYASVRVKVAFASGDLSSVCKNVQCDFAVATVSDRAEP